MGREARLRRAIGDRVGESIGRIREPLPGAAGAGQGGDAAPPPPWRTTARLEGLTRDRAAALIPTAKIAPDPDQPRKDFDPEELARLAESLKARGQLQPIRVRWEEGQGAYLIVCGERRWRAARMAGMLMMACVVVEGELSPSERLTVQLVENALREDLKPIEQAAAYRTLMETNGWSTRRLAEEIGVGDTAIVKAVALLDLPAPVKALVEAEKVTPATAYEVSKIPDPARQVAVANRVVAEKLTRSDVTAIRKGGAAPGSKGAVLPGAAPPPPAPRPAARKPAPAPLMKETHRFWDLPGEVHVDIYLPADAATDADVRAALYHLAGKLKGGRRPAS